MHNVNIAVHYLTEGAISSHALDLIHSRNDLAYYGKLLCIKSPP